MTPERKALMIMTGIGVSELWAIWGVAAGSGRRALVSGLVGGTPAGWLAAAATAACFIVVTMARLPLIRTRLLEVSPLKIAAVAFALIAGVAEEFWFRKIPMDWAARHGQSALVQVAFAAILFGLAHGVWGMFARRWRAAASAVVATGALGAALAVTYLLAGRDVAPCIWSHVVINLVLEPWLLVAVMTRGTFAATARTGGAALPA